VTSEHMDSAEDEASMVDVDSAIMLGARGWGHVDRGVRLQTGKVTEVVCDTDICDTTVTVTRGPL